MLSSKEMAIFVGFQNQEGMKLFSDELVREACSRCNITDLSTATIGEILLAAQYLEKKTGVPFVRMDQGSPGLPINRYGVEAEKRALDSGICSQYPPAAGHEGLKQAAARFVKAFIDIDIAPECCIPTTGSVEGSFAAFAACTQRIPGKDKVLFIDPGFPIQKSQLRVLGIRWRSFDIYSWRGAARLRVKLEEELSRGDIAAIIYSNPDNPAWTCLEEEELAVIGELATEYDAVVMEDLAYFCMDYRRELGRPFQAPFVPTAARAGKTFPGAVRADRSEIYRQLYPDALGIEDIQLCRPENSPRLHRKPPFRASVPGSRRKVRRRRGLRSNADIVNTLYDHERLHLQHAVRLC